MRTSVFGFQSLVNSFVKIGSFSCTGRMLYYKLGGSSSERHIVVSLSKTESVHIQKNIVFSKKALQLRFSNLAMKKDR